ncbi:right-handed parallel beta-helix repeat-containing protein, partial [Neisseria montereyensis]
NKQPEENQAVQPPLETEKNDTTAEQTEPAVSAKSEDKTTNQSSDTENVPETPDTKQENTTQQPSETNKQPEENQAVQPPLETEKNDTTAEQTEPAVSAKSEDKTTNQSSDSENVPETPDTKQENTTQQPSETNKQPEENQAVQPPLETEKNETTAEQTEPAVSAESEDKTTNQSSDSENVPEAPDTKQASAAQQPSENIVETPVANTEEAASTPTYQTGNYGDYYLYTHPVYGKYIDAAQFGTDPTGQQDSLQAINAALDAAHKENAAVHLSGHLYISDQIVLNQNNSGVTGLFGDGMGKTEISFDKAQKGIFNSNSNEDDIREYAGILIDGQNHKTIADLSVKYTNPDFYRKGESYFGKVSGILVNDADYTLISKVEASGANRAGVHFTSTQTLESDPHSNTGRTYKVRLMRNEVDEHYEHLPLGENNRIIDSYLHHNRVAGALIAYQKDFIVDGNTLSWNGHKADGGTGYGVSSMAGSYNYGVTFSNNTTDHNYRKGLDVHDGDNILIENNTSIGDRLYGIAVYNRQFNMDTVKIINNTITQDTSFRLPEDDNPKLSPRYHGYSGIQLQTNTQLRDFHHAEDGSFKIEGNTIKNLEVYKDSYQTYGIEFRNHENKMDYQLDITGNTIEGTSSKYAIATISNTQSKTGVKGSGTALINITDNDVNIGEIVTGTMPIFINDYNHDGNLRGSVTVSNNDIKIAEHSNGSIEGIQMIGNAESYLVTNNRFELHGEMNKAIVSLLGRDLNDTPDLHVTGNDFFTDLTGPLYKNWIERKNANVYAEDNTHNTQTLPQEGQAAKPSAGTTPNDEHTDSETDWDIGTDTIAGKPLNTEHDIHTIDRSESVVLQQADNDHIFDTDAVNTPALNDLLSAPALELSGVLGVPAHNIPSNDANIITYAQSWDIQDEYISNEAPAYIM